MDRCPECIDGKGWVVTDMSGQTTVRPCFQCNGPAYGRWRAGAYAPTPRQERSRADEATASPDEVREALARFADRSDDL